MTSQERQTHIAYLQRAVELGQRAASLAEPNPRVGAVVVANGQIIGEGWHTACGKPHAEVEALQSVPERLRHLLPTATLYVTLEPCSHFGRTPPCTNLILRESIPHVVVACVDPNPRVSGIDILQASGVRVDVVPYAPADALLQHFYVNQRQARPFVTLKWAQDANGMMGHTQHRLLLTSAKANRFVHNLRAQHAAIAVGQGTLLQDLPALTVRHSCGHSPKRIVFWGSEGQWPIALWEFGESESLLIADKPPKGLPNSITVLPPQGTLKLTLESLYREYQVGSILVEGGAAVLTSSLQASLADEVVVIHAPRSLAGNVSAPSLPANFHLSNSIDLHPDVAWIYNPKHHT